MLERRLADADVSQEDQMNVLKYLEQKETEYMHLQRHKMGVDDFQLLTIIGRGAFGEVLFFLACTVVCCCQWTCLFISNALALYCICCKKMQVRICREKSTGHVYAMKKLKKSEMLRRGQVLLYQWYHCYFICFKLNP